MSRYNSALILVIAVLSGCEGETANVTPIAYDIAFIEGTPEPYHLRFLSANGELSPRVYLPNGMEVYYGSDHGLSWSPDGARIAFSSSVNGNLDVYTIAANGTALQRITSDPGRDQSPAWSPDGSKIAFVSNRNYGDECFGQDVYVHDLVTGVETRLTTPCGNFISPAWAPDNAKLAYIRIVGAFGPDEIVVQDVADGTTTSLSVSMYSYQGLQWSPSTNKLLFYSWIPCNVYSINADGTGLQNLTPTPTDDESFEPSWYSGGRILYVRGFTAAVSAVYYMNADGSGKSVLHAFDNESWGSNPVYRFASPGLPDLVVLDPAMSCGPTNVNSPTCVVRFMVGNIGTGASTLTSAYVDAINPDPPPGTNEIRGQQQVAVPPLAPGERAELQVAFDSREIRAWGVRRIQITVDPKQLVAEAFETNNSIIRP